MTGPRQEAPPPNGRKRTDYDWDEVRKAIEAANGEWVLVNTDGPMNTSIRYALERGNMAAMRPPERFDFTTRNNTLPPRRTCDLYIRLKEEHRKEG